MQQLMKLKKEYFLLFQICKKDFPYVCTMHSLGTRQLNIDTNTQLLKDEKWNSFKNFSQICKDLSFESRHNPETGYNIKMNT
jgi:hypothetical protein